jgi:hypothetical protein
MIEQDRPDAVRRTPPGNQSCHPPSVMRRSDYTATLPPTERLVEINIASVHQPNPGEVIIP